MKTETDNASADATSLRFASMALRELDGTVIGGRPVSRVTGNRY